MARNVTLTTLSKTGVITFSGNISNADTVRIGDIQYTFATDPTGEAFEVDVGTDEDTSINNLVAAINASGTDDDEYGAGTTQHPYVEATADTANDEIDIVARLPGDFANHIAVAQSGTNLGAGGATLGAVSGGTDGAGDLSDFVQGLLDLNQVNAEMITELLDLVR